MRFWKLLAITACVLTLGCSRAPGGSATDVADAEASIRAFWEAVDRYDFAAIEAALTDDFEVLKASGKNDRDEFLSSLRRAQASGRQLSFDLSEFNTEVVGDVAYVRYRSSSRTSDSQWWELIILTRTDDGWQVDRGFSVPIR